MRLYAYATSECTLPLAGSHIHSLSLAVFSRERSNNALYFPFTAISLMELLTT